MAKSSTIREYLVAIGYKIDQESSDDFDRNMKSGAKLAGDLATAVETAAAAVVGAVAKMAKGLGQLYYESKRTGSSAKDIDAFSYAIEQLGGNADAARSSIQRMALQFKANPQMVQALKDLTGVDAARNDNGEINTEKTLERMAEHFAALNSEGKTWLALKLGDLFKVDTDTMQTILMAGPDAIRKFEDQRREAFKGMGIDLDDLSKKSVEFNQQFAMFGTLATAVWYKIGGALMSVLTPALVALNDQTSNWHVALEALLVYTTTKWVAGMLGAVAKVMGGISAAEGATAAGGLGMATKAGLVGLAGFGGYQFGSWLNDKFDLSTKIGDGIDAMREGFQSWKNDPEIKKNLEALGKVGKNISAGPSAYEPLGLRQNNPGNLRSWGNTPVVGGFASFGSAAEGLSAMAGNLLTYANRGWNSVREIISHWAPASENDTNAYIRDVTRRLGVGADQGLNLRDRNVMAQMMDAIISHEQGRDPFTNAELVNAADARLSGGGGRGGTAVAVHQRNEFNIHGSNAQEIAGAVGDRLDATTASGVSAHLPTMR